jgi:AcrR family transcriptional regulator
MRGLNAGGRGQEEANKGGIAAQKGAEGSASEQLGEDQYRERILTAAQTLFHEHGYEKVSMYQIARTAAIGQGSLYRRFADKGEICSALLRTNSEQLLIELEQAAASRPAAEPAMALLDHTIRKAVDFVDERADLLMLIKAQSMGKRQLTQFEHPFFQRLNAIMVHLLTQATENGEITGVDPHFTASALVAVLSPDLYLYQQKYHQASKTDTLQGMLRLFVTGLKTS